MFKCIDLWFVEDVIDLWMMKEYNVKESWTKLLSASLDMDQDEPCPYRIYAQLWWFIVSPVVAQI